MCFHLLQMVRPGLKLEMDLFFVYSQSTRVLPAWAEVRDDSNPSVDWLIVGYDGSSKTDITVLFKGDGGIAACSEALPERMAVFGGSRLTNGRFVTFFFADHDTPTMQRGRASMHKNGASCEYAWCMIMSIVRLFSHSLI